MLKKKDFFLLTALLLTGVVLTIIIYMPSHASGNYVQIRQNGKLIKEVPLSDNRKFLFYENHTMTDTLDPASTSATTKENPSPINVIVIENGEVFMQEADCPDKACVRQGKIRQSGEAIICLPHQLTVEIPADKAGENAEPEIDGISR
ncbi:MAG: NusG domain II-containing protein [Lachnospiraceae bacterium]|nr:NusG domain II-containing protein [Lachnospiraceae bacterium]